MDAAFRHRWRRLRKRDQDLANVLELRSRISTGGGTWCTADQQFSGDGAAVLGSAVLSADVNADGRKDVVLAFGNGGGALEIRTNLSNGNGTWSSAIQTFPDGGGIFAGKVMAGDVNADGKTDVVFAVVNTWSSPGLLEIRTKFSSGDGTWTAAGAGFSEGGQSLGGSVLPADITRDGRVDLVSAFLSQG